MSNIVLTEKDYDYVFVWALQNEVTQLPSPNIEESKNKRNGWEFVRNIFKAGLFIKKILQIV